MYEHRSCSDDAAQGTLGPLVRANSKETLHEANGRETLHQANGREILHQANSRETLLQANSRETPHQANARETLHQAKWQLELMPMVATHRGTCQGSMASPLPLSIHVIPGCPGGAPRFLCGRGTRPAH